MKIDSLILSTEKIFEIISKTESNFYCVFIQPNGIVDFEKYIDKLKLNCTKEDLLMENRLLEIYEDKKEANKRVMQFRNEYLSYFYVCCYKNSKFINENT